MAAKERDYKSALHQKKGVDPPAPINPSPSGNKGKMKGNIRSAAEYAEGIRAGNRALLSKAITLVESSLESHQEIAREIIDRCLPFSGRSMRLGITGVPGVGKSTFIEALGRYLTGKGHKLGVLAIDPSSKRSKGSILGDKTRMEELASDPDAYIRPSPTGGSLGGVARKTREAIILCEAAGFDIIFVETVGVGQSETTVNAMVDFFLLLMLAGAGDELQGIKKGIMEMADAIVINKADRDNLRKANLARKEYENALHLFPPNENGWTPQALTCSALEKRGIDDIWKTVQEFLTLTRKNGHFEQKRREQAIEIMHTAINEALHSHFSSDPAVQDKLRMTENEVLKGNLSPYHAAHQLVNRFLDRFNK